MQFCRKASPTGVLTMHYPLRIQKYVITGHAARLFTSDVQVRVFVVVAKYCATAVWEDERQAIFDGMRGSGLLSPGRLAEYFSSWWYAIKNISLFLFSHLSALQEVRDIIHVIRSGVSVKSCSLQEIIDGS